jgi:hypothetical protein
MKVARSLLYAHCVIVAVLVGFATWGLGHYRDTGASDFALLVEWILSFLGASFGHGLLQGSSVAFPIAVYCAIAAAPNRATWRSAVMIVLDLLLSVIQFLSLVIVSPTRY